MKQQNSISNILIENCYQGIEDMPIWNWNQILQTGDLKYLFIKNSGRVSKKIGDHWDNIQDQYIAEFGLDENYQKELKLLKKKASLNYEFIYTGDRFINTKLKIVEADLLSLKQDGKGIKFHDLKDRLEKYKGYRIDPKITTVIEWHYTLKNMTDGKAN